MSSLRQTFVEIELPVCTLTYGEAPCTAAIGVTGEKKCFNTRKTCQDINNYDEDFETLRLAKATIDLEPDIIAIPNIQSVDYTPSKIMLGESIGARSVLTVTCTDHPFPDTGPGGDKYRDSRDYIPFETGTFWGKLKARHPFLRGHILRWYNGKVNGRLETFERRTFVIDRIEGPGTSGQTRIVAKDPITLVDDQRAVAPRMTRGFIDADINDSATSITLEPAGIGNTDYPASGFASIGGNEIVSFTRSGDVMTITRGQYNTEAQAHDEGDRVQLCLEYSAEDLADIIYDLMVTYGNVPASFIPLSSWKSETGGFIGNLYNGLIPEPTPVKDLVNELLEQSASSIWWDEPAELMRFQVLRNIPVQPFVYDDDTMMAGSFTQKEQPEKRVSQVWTYYGQINPLESLTDAKNYKNTIVEVDLASESDYGTPAIKKIYSRWITAFGREIAERLNKMILSRFVEPPKVFTFSLMRDSGVIAPSLGGGIQVASFFSQDDEGKPETLPCQIISLKAGDSSWNVTAEQVTQGDIDLPDIDFKLIPIDSNEVNFNLRTEYLRLYPDAVSGQTVECTIRSGVIVTSETTATPAFSTGTGWAAGVTVRLVLEEGAVIAGKGGNGGSATMSGFSSSASNGQAGGLALKVESDIEIENNGIIGGGGGGGGGAASWALSVIIPVSSSAHVASGGGGGAGISIGGNASASGSGSTQSRNGLPGGVSTGGNGVRANATESKLFGILKASASATGGNGGGLGQAGSNGTRSASGNFSSGGSTGNGGAAGIAVDGDSLVTWTELGDVRGSRIN